MVSRKIQSSVSYAEANHEKLIHAHEIANVANANPTIAGADVALGEQVGQLVGGDAERDHERQVEQQLERGRGAVRLCGSRPPIRVRRCTEKTAMAESQERRQGAGRGQSGGSSPGGRRAVSPAAVFALGTPANR